MSTTTTVNRAVRTLVHTSCLVLFSMYNVRFNAGEVLARFIPCLSVLSLSSTEMFYGTDAIWSHGLAKT